MNARLFLIGKGAPNANASSITFPKNGKKLTKQECSLNLWNNEPPGHTSLDGKVYQYGMLDLKERIAHELRNLDS
mgnify:FL=1